MKIISFSLLIMATIGCSTRWADAPIPEEPWKKYDREAQQAINSQQYDVAEGNIYKSANEFGKNSSESGVDDYKLSIIFLAQGRFAEAAKAQKEKLQAGKKSGMILSEIALDNLIIGETYLFEGRFDDALAYYKNAMDGFTDPQAKIGNVNRYIGRYYIQIGNYEEAIRYLKEASAFYISIHTISQNIAKAENDLALAYYYAGNDKEAESLFRNASGLNVNAVVGFPHDLAISLTMLGRIAEHHSQGDQALKFYQSAREALHMYRLVDKLDDADLWNQIGRFQLKQGNSEESAKAYHEALILRKETGTSTHPNCADTLKGMADISAYRGELTSATLQASKALEILDASVVPTHPRIAQELVALASILILSGKSEQAAALNARLETILQKPLGPWKEDFLETTAFYAGLLKKAEKITEAERLAQLQIRQKDKR